MMKRMVMGLALVAAAGCSKKEDPKKPAEVPAAENKADVAAPAPAAAEADAAPAAEADAAPAAPAADAAPTQAAEVAQAGDAAGAPLTGEAFAARHKECLAAFSAKDEAKLKDCFAEGVTFTAVDSGMPEATSADAVVAMFKPYWAGFSDLSIEPQLILVQDGQLVSLDLVKGTHTGDFMGVPASNKKVGFLMAHHVEADSTGTKAQKVQTWMDQNTLMAQIGASPAPARAALEASPVESAVVVATGSEAEKANLAAVKKAYEAVNAHDVEAYMGTVVAEPSEYDQASHEDVKGAEAMKQHLAGFFAMMPDVKINVAKELAAGDWTAVMGNMTGTNTGAMGEMPATNKAMDVGYIELNKVEDGKIAQTFRIWNSFKMAQQLGLVPAPGEQPAAPTGDAPADDAPAAPAGDAPAEPTEPAPAE